MNVPLLAPTNSPNASEGNVLSSGSSNILPTKPGFKIAKLNFKSYIDELRILLADYSIDILVINETKLDESIKNSDLCILGYKFVRRDRDRNGGSMGFHIKSFQYFLNTFSGNS